MHFFFTDETKASDVSEGRRPIKADCFVYGGIIVPEISMGDLKNFLYEIKDNNNIPQIVELKWRFEDFLKKLKRIPDIDNSIKNLSKMKNPELYNSMKKKFDKLKTEVLDYIAQHREIRIVVALRPTSLLKMKNKNALDFSIVNIAEKFDKILEKIQDFGVIAADDFLPKTKKYQEYKKIIELSKFGTERRRLKQIAWIIPNIISEISPIHQINDIVLGCFSFYIYSYIRKLDGHPETLKISKPLLEKIIDNFYVSAPSKFGDRLILGSGILIYPPRITRSPETWTGQFLNGLEEQLKTDFRIL